MGKRQGGRGGGGAALRLILTPFGWLGALTILFAAPGCRGAPAQVVQPHASPAPIMPVMQGQMTANRIRGVWRSRGYGWVLTVSDRALELRHETAEGCYADPAGTSEVLDLFRYSQAGPERAVYLFGHQGETRVLFDRIERLPLSCSRERVWDAPAIFDIFAATFSEHYPFFKERGINWAARVNAGRAEVSSGMPDQRLFDVLTKTLQGLGDAHVQIEAKIGADPLTYEDPHSRTLELLSARARAAGQPEKEVERAWLRAYRKGVEQVILGGKGQHDASSRIFWGLAAPRVGYLNVITMGGYAKDAPLEKEIAALDLALDQAMLAFAGASAVIVDVTNNRGGYDVIARSLASRFAGEERLAYSKQAYRAHGVSPQIFHVEPSTHTRFLGPVYLLTSDVTVSAGEVFALDMRALPSVIHLGTPTRGAFSDVLVKPLPNGWTVHLSNEIYLDAKGHAVEGLGVSPQETIDFFPEGDLSGGHAAAVRRLVERIQ